MTDKEALLEKKRKIEKELEEIQLEEQRIRNEKEKHKIIKFMDSIHTILEFVAHSRTSCSDDNRKNDYTTYGRGGYFRCNRCALLNAADEWDANSDWLRDSSYDCISANLDICSVEVEATVKTKEI